MDNKAILDMSDKLNSVHISVCEYQIGHPEHHWLMNIVKEILVLIGHMITDQIGIEGPKDLEQQIEKADDHLKSLILKEIGCVGYSDAHLDTQIRRAKNNLEFWEKAKKAQERKLNSTFFYTFEIGMTQGEFEEICDFLNTKKVDWKWTDSPTKSE